MEQLDLFIPQEKVPADVNVPKSSAASGVKIQNEHVEVVYHAPAKDETEKPVKKIPPVSIQKKTIVLTKKEKESSNGKRGRKSYKEMDAELILVEVPDDDELFKKQYYPISEVAEWFHVNTSLIRFWETEFDILKPRKNRKGDRLFRPEDVKNLQAIYYLLRQRKFSIEGAKNYLKENKKNVDNNLRIIQSLTKFRSFLLELKANL